MAATTNGSTSSTTPYSHLLRPRSSTLDVPLTGDESLELDFDDIFGSDQAEGVFEVIAGTFAAERLGAQFWTRAVTEYWSRGKRNLAQELAERGVQGTYQLSIQSVDLSLSRACTALREQGRAEAAIPLLCQLANFNLVLSRTAPATKLEDAREDKLGPEVLTKQHYLDRASARSNEAAALDAHHPLVLDSRGAFDSTSACRSQLMPKMPSALLCVSQKGKEKEATQAIDATLSKSPNHLPALLLRARLMLRAGPSQARSALKIFQNVLSMAPRSLPDPRIGIGSCLWALGDKARARQAWERSLVVVSPSFRPDNLEQCLTSCLSASIRTSTR